MFHLLTHAFFKALLFLGSGSVIHGCHEEQDIRRMGALRHAMPITFATYAVGMMALCGVPLFFSGFWSKDEILHAASAWSVSKVPFYLGLFGALLTAFYMTRQVYYVFFGVSRLGQNGHGHEVHAHESPAVMTVPLVILAVASIAVGFFGTPAWNWLHGYLTGHAAEVSFSKLFEGGTLLLMAASTVVVAIGIGFSWLLYSRKCPRNANEADPIEAAQPAFWRVLANKFYVDELYEATVIRLNAVLAAVSDWFDRVIWNGVVNMVKLFTEGFARISRSVDQSVVNGGFDETCGSIRRNAGFFSRLQNGHTQTYLRVIGVAMAVLVLLLLWGCRS